MGLLDKLKKNKIAGKAADIAAKSGDKIAAGVDKATDMVDKKTGGKYHDKLEKVDGAVGKAMDKLDGDKTDAAAEAASGDAEEASGDAPAAT